MNRIYFKILYILFIHVERFFIQPLVNRRLMMNFSANSVCNAGVSPASCSQARRPRYILAWNVLLQC
jgi:hypothetical protein